ncbi:MAG: hypothetical protein K6G00_03375 [Treponema sp.]|nr:hypothetical protein [Treponema sp.]
MISISDNNMKKICNEKYDVFIFGTLAQRSDTNRKTLYSLLKNLQVKNVFFDVNLRKNFYSKEIIENSLTFADILKMNDEEIPIIADLLGYSKCNDEFIYELIKNYKLKGIITTLGKKGSAAFLVALVKGKSIEECLNYGSKLAEFVVSKNGALPIYDNEIKQTLI